MPLERVLEPEVMDSPDEADSYDAIDHSQVNRVFVDNLLACCELEEDDFHVFHILDLGTGTAQIPIELCRRAPGFRVMAADAAIAMLELARYNIEVASVTDRIQLERVDAKKLPYADRCFAVVMSNSIIHHIPEPLEVLREAVRVTKPGGLIFFRDLLRPENDVRIQMIVAEHAADSDDIQRQMLEASLRAALDLTEIRALVVQLGFPAESVQATSDRHWTWSVRKDEETAHSL
jgi:ubiquinone/menaquinone biosynthesis C-methylase UbiE